MSKILRKLFGYKAKNKETGKEFYLPSNIKDYDVTERGQLINKSKNKIMKMLTKKERRRLRKTLKDRALNKTNKENLNV